MQSNYAHERVYGPGREEEDDQDDSEWDDYNVEREAEK